MTRIKSSQSGFVLLITLLMITVVVTVTLSVIELTMRQLQLSVDGRDAERAFQAASAGVECAQRTVRVASTTIRDTTDPPLLFDCFGNSTATSSNTTDLTISFTSSAPAPVRRYRQEIQWDNRCTEIDLFVVLNDDALLVGTTSVTNMQNFVANYRPGVLECGPSSVCYVTAASGYSSTCANKNQLGVLKRELLLD